MAFFCFRLRLEYSVLTSVSDLGNTFSEAAAGMVMLPKGRAALATARVDVLRNFLRERGGQSPQNSGAAFLFMARLYRIFVGSSAKLIVGTTLTLASWLHNSPQGSSVRLVRLGTDGRLFVSSAD
jgi:hypothetical protein